MRIYGFCLPRQVHGCVLCENSDIPATRKLTGVAGHSHKKYPCNYCVILLTDLDTDTAYDIENFRLRNDEEQLRHTNDSNVARTEVARKAILDEHGKYFTEFLVAGYLLDSSGWSTFESTVNNIMWPSGIGRLPTNLSDDHSLPKADQWRRLSSILPVVLWVCWKDQRGRINKVAPNIPANAKTQPKFKRNLPAIYNLVLYLSVAERILASKAISVNDVDRGQRYLQLYCQGLHKIGAHQTINNHLAMHYSLVFRRFGPAYAMWLFGFERFNGVLENVNLNGHGGGEMEYSLAREWVEKHHLYELAISLPADATDKERKLVERIVKVKGED
ncbi:hypothetical protein F4604DRAFT_1935131 [Suillus subluteus]|nr:hypothetical protein F4604DRAFT_1935131 [Suillus subluteus]